MFEIHIYGAVSIALRIESHCFKTEIIDIRPIGPCHAKIVHPRSLIRPALTASRITGYYIIYKLGSKTRVIICACAG